MGEDETELQDFGEYIYEWVERADRLIDEKEKELDALIEKRNEAAKTVGEPARGEEHDDGGEENGPRQGSLEEDEDEDR
jgi:hypothetical protein